MCICGLQNHLLMSVVQSLEPNKSCASVRCLPLSSSGNVWNQFKIQDWRCSGGDKYMTHGWKSRFSFTSIYSSLHPYMLLCPFLPFIQPCLPLSLSATALFNHPSILASFHFFFGPCPVRIYLSFPSYASLSTWLTPAAIYPTFFFLLHPQLSFTGFLPPLVPHYHHEHSGFHSNSLSHTHTIRESHMDSLHRHLCTHTNAHTYKCMQADGH